MSRAAVHDAVHGWCGELRRGKRRSGISFGGTQIAASERKPASIAQANGEPAAVSGLPRLGDRGLEQWPQLRIPFGQEKRERDLRKPRCEREPRPAVRVCSCAAFGQKRSGCEVGDGLGGLVRKDGDERGRSQYLGWRRGIPGGTFAQRLAAEGHRACGQGVVQRGQDSRSLELERELDMTESIADDVRSRTSTASV